MRTTAPLAQQPGVWNHHLAERQFDLRRDMERIWQLTDDIMYPTPVTLQGQPFHIVVIRPMRMNGEKYHQGQGKMVWKSIA